MIIVLVVVMGMLIEVVVYGVVLMGEVVLMDGDG